MGRIRLLEVGNRVVVPAKTHISILAGAIPFILTISHCAGEEDVIFEIPSPAASISDLLTEAENTDGPKLLRAIEKKNEIERKILAIPRIHAKFVEAQNVFPEITERIPPEEAFRHIVTNIIVTPKALRGMDPDASLAEVHCYIRWLCRIERGSSIEEYSFYNVPQKHVNDIDIKHDILSF